MEGSEAEVLFDALCADAHQTATEHGFTEASVGEDIALMHSELSEALEDYRAGRKPGEIVYDVVLEFHGGNRETHLGISEALLKRYQHDPEQWPVVKSAKPCGIPSELADVIIRILHFCGKHNVPLGRAVREKMAFNKTREHKHGGKKL